eukprot:970360-Alexandrium_andersonii.AAC.1
MGASWAPGTQGAHRGRVLMAPQGNRGCQRHPRRRPRGGRHRALVPSCLQDRPAGRRHLASAPVR